MKISYALRRVREEANPIRFLASRILAKTRISELLKMKIHRDGYQLHFFNTAMSMTLWLEKNAHMDDIHVIRSLLPRGGIYVDIGANIGDLTIAAANAIGPTGKVYAFEAHPRIYRLLQENLRLNRLKNVYAVSVACGNDFGWTQFSDKPSDDMNSVGSGDLLIAVLPAQALLTEPHFDLIKIDVEGFELHVLEGLTKVLPLTKSLMLEVGDQHFERFGYCFSAIYHVLTAAGFELSTVSVLSGNVVLEPINNPDRTFERVQNMIATRKTQTNQFR